MKPSLQRTETSIPEKEVERAARKARQVEREEMVDGTGRPHARTRGEIVQLVNGAPVVYNSSRLHVQRRVLVSNINAEVPPEILL